MAFKSLGETIINAVDRIETTQSPIESLMLSALMRHKDYILVKDGQDARGIGLFVYPQFPIDSYRADFLVRGVGFVSGRNVWPPNKQVKIVIECDGEEFHTSKERRSYDKERDDFFFSKGIKTFRFSGSEIYRNSDLIAKDLANYLHGEIFRK